MHSPKATKRILLILTVLAAIPACGEATGACDGFSPTLGHRYCKDDYTEGECADWNRQGVNGASWSFHEGQTCEQRGCGGGSC